MTATTTRAAARDAAAARIPALLAAMRDVIARYTFLVSIHGEIE